jgi:hypothetical protein
MAGGSHGAAGEKEDPMRKLSLWTVTCIVGATIMTACGGSSSSDSTGVGLDGDENVITHPEDFYIYFYDRSYQQYGTGSLSVEFIIDDYWNHTNQAEGNTPFADVQSDDGGRIHVFWEIGRKDSTQDSDTFQSKLADNGQSCAFTLATRDDQKVATYIPEKMNFGISGQLSFFGYGYADMVLGQTGDGPWHEIKHQIKEAIKDSVYAEAFEGADVDEDLETFEHIADVIKDIAGFNNVWTVGANGVSVGSTVYPAAMINWNDHSIPHCDNPHQAMVVPLQSGGAPTGYHILVMPRDCDDDHEIAVVLWDFSLD